MPLMNVDTKTGFRTNDLKIRIYDDEANMFYFHDKTQGATFFNLPRGRYLTNNKLYELPFPRIYKMPQMPAKERFKKIPNDLKVEYGNNPYKASIYFDLNKILLDNAIKNLNKPQRIHIIFHELAHYFYETEKYCDLWAARRMLKIGYNPSQVFFSVYGELSNNDDALERKSFILNHCENSFK